MSNNNQFNLFTGELRTSTNLYPVQFIINGVTYLPLLTSYNTNISGQLATQNYLQGGAGSSVYLAGKRSFQIDISFPIRIDINKNLDPFAAAMIQASFQTGNVTPGFTIQIANFKTTTDFLTSVGTGYYDSNSNIYLPLLDTCFIQNMTLTVDANTKVTMNCTIKGSLSKDINAPYFTGSSALTSLTSSFINYKVLTFADCGCFMKGSYMPNVTGLTFTITKQIQEEKFIRSIDNKPPLGFSAPQVLSYSNDLPAKSGVTQFTATGKINQVLRTLSEDLYFSRSGVGTPTNYSFINYNFGPIAIARNYSLLQQTTQPFQASVLSIENDLIFTKTPIVNQADFLSIITTGIW